MNNLLAEALRIIRGTDADDIRTRARGRRAHARVLPMIDLAENTARWGREQRIANLLAMAQVDNENAEWALDKAWQMLTDDAAAPQIPLVLEQRRSPRHPIAHDGAGTLDA